MAIRSGFTALFSTSTYDKPKVEGLSFDWLMVGLAFWFLGGLFIDGWAHASGKTDQTFFTPWHAILYSGFVVVSAALLSIVYINVRRGFKNWAAIPAGYELSVIGVSIFAAGGVGDMVWHQLFGVEKTTEALLSPSHLALALGIALVLSGPLRATWGRLDTGEALGWSKLLPMLFSVIFLLSILTFFTEFVNPVSAPYAVYKVSAPREANRYVSLGVSSYLIYSSLLIGMLLLVMRRWRLPFGSITLIVTLNALLMCAISLFIWVIPAMFVTGLVADILYAKLRLHEPRSEAVRLFAFIVPLTMFLLYFLTLWLTAPTRGLVFSWSIHLWMGATVFAGFAGLLISFLVYPPAHPTPK